MTIQHQIFTTMFPGGAGSIPPAFTPQGTVDASNAGSLPVAPVVGDWYIVSITGGTKNFNGTWDATAAAGFTGATFNVGDSIAYTAGGWIKFVGSATSTDDVINVSTVVGITASDAFDTLLAQINGLAASDIANDSSVGGVTVKDALETLEAEISATGTTYPYIFRPGGVALGNVFTSWAALYAVYSTNSGPRLIQFDNTFSAITIPAGAYDFTSTILEGRDRLGVIGNTTVNFADGCTITGLEEVTNNLTLRCNNTLVPLFSIDTKTVTNRRLFLRDGAIIRTVSAQPFLDISASAPAGIFAIYMENASMLGNGTVHISSANASLTVVMYHNTFLLGSTIFTDVPGADAIAINVFAPSAIITDPTGLNTQHAITYGNFQAQMSHSLTEASTLSTNPYTVVKEDYRIDYDASTGNGAVNLPSSSLNENIGRCLIIKKHWLDTTTNSVQINANGLELIDGQPFVTISDPYESITLMSFAGIGWDIISRSTTAASSSPVFVFQPGGTPSGNVYDTWSTLYAAYSAMQGVRTIEFDDTFASLTIPVGAYDFHDTQLRAMNLLTTLVDLADGVTITNLANTDVFGLRIRSNNTVVPVSSLDGTGLTGPYLFQLNFGGSLIVAGTQPFIDLTNFSLGFILSLQEGNLNSGTAPIVQISDTNTGVQIILIFGANVDLSTLADIPAANPITFNFLGTSNQVYGTSSLNTAPGYFYQNRAAEIIYGSSAVTSNYLIAQSDYTVYGDATGGSFTISLLQAPQTGKRFTIPKLDASANTVTVDVVGGGTINGVTTKVITTQFEAYTFEWDGSEYKIISSFNAPVTVQTNIGTISFLASPYSLTANDDTLLVDATTGPITVVFPDAFTYGRKIFAVKKKDATGNAVTCIPTGANLLEGAASIVMTTPGQAITMQSDGGDYYMIGRV